MSDSGREWGASSDEDIRRRNNQKKAKDFQAVAIQDLRRAIEPVANWFDLDGEESEPLDILSVIKEVAKTLVEDRQNLLLCRKALLDIVNHQKLVGGSLSQYSSTLRIAQKALDQTGGLDMSTK